MCSPKKTFIGMDFSKDGRVKALESYWPSFSELLQLISSSISGTLLCGIIKILQR